MNPIETVNEPLETGSAFLQVIDFWLDIERYYSITPTEVFEKWQRFREIQMKYLTTGPYEFPDSAHDSIGILKGLCLGECAFYTHTC